MHLSLKKHISIINPKLIILLGSTAMEVFSEIRKFLNQRGVWKELIVNNKTYLTMVTFPPCLFVKTTLIKKNFLG